MNIVNSMLAKEFGGIGQAALNYNEVFLSHGHEVVTFYRKGSIWEEKFLAQQKRYPKQLRLISLSAGGGIKSLLGWLKMRRHLKTLKPDVVVAHNYLRPHYLACFGIAPIVAPTHMYKFKQLRKYHGVVALTGELYQHCLAQGIEKERLFYIPNVLTNVTPCSEVRGMRMPIVIGAMGRLSPEKGLDYFIEALALLKKQDVPFKALIGGRGPQEEELKLLARNYQLGSQLEFLGYVTDQEEFYSRIDILCVPSTREPFGLVVLEAWHYGVPIIAAKVGGLVSLIRSGETGLLVEPASALAIANAIQQLVANHDEGEAMVRSGREELYKNYTPEMVYPEFIEMFKAVMQKQKVTA